MLWTAYVLQAERFNTFLAQLDSPGYRPPDVLGPRGTQKYWTPGLAGVWARSLFLDNGSVRTMEELLTPPSARAASFRRSDAGHDHGTELSAADKRDLIEHLKTR